LPSGSLVEFLSAADGSGAWTLALLMANQACGERKALVVADVQRGLYPPAVVRLGLNLDRLIVVHPKTQRELCTAAEQSLRCAAVGAVVGWCYQLPAPDYRRLQLAAEAGGGVGFFLQPARALRAPSFASLRLLVAPEPAGEPARRLKVEVVRCRSGEVGRFVILEVDGETGDVRLPAAVVPPAADARAGRASG
jgi:hypothetical protein